MSQQHDEEYWANRNQELQAQYRKFLKAHGVSVKGRGLEAAINNIQIITMATRKAMLELVVETPGKTKKERKSIKKAAEESRHYYLRYLWEHDLLDTPWRILVDQEFPGDPPTTKDFERYVSEAAEAMLLSHEHQEKLDRLRESIEVLLEENGYEVDWEDGIAIIRLTSLIVMSEVRVEDFTSEDRLAARKLAKKDVKEAREPDHPAWKAVLNTYFPKP